MSGCSADIRSIRFCQEMHFVLRQQTYLRCDRPHSGVTVLRFESIGAVPQVVQDGMRLFINGRKHLAK
jgi:hypothetical protein